MNITIRSFLLLEGDPPGLKDDDYKASEATLQSIAQTLDLECVMLRERPAQEGKVAEFLLRRRLTSDDFMEIRYVTFYLLDITNIIQNFTWLHSSLA